MAEMPFMKFFPSDYLRDTDILSLSAQGAWMRMICAAWHPTRKGILSFPLPTVARLIHTDEPDARRILSEIEDCGVADFQWSADGQAVAITCRRIVRDWQTATQNKADISTKRAAAAHARWEKERQSKCNANASQMECPPESRNQNPDMFPLLSPKGERRKRSKQSKARGTLDELKSFAVEIGVPSEDGEDCFDRWEGNGWKNNGKAIADWQATMRTWKRGGFLASQKNGSAPKAGSVIIGGRSYAEKP